MLYNNDNSNNTIDNSNINNNSSSNINVPESFPGDPEDASMTLILRGI